MSTFADAVGSLSSTTLRRSSFPRAASISHGACYTMRSASGPFSWQAGVSKAA
jgi:hypothetical protein